MNIHINCLRIAITILITLSINTWQKCYLKQFFSVAHLNIRSIPANLSAFLSLIDSLDYCFTVIGLSETWLNPSNVSTYGINGYNHVYQTRCTSRGGGVSLFVSEKIVFSEMSDYCMVNDYIESLFVKITNNGTVSVIGVVYRPPNSNVVQV